MIVNTQPLPWDVWDTLIVSALALLVLALLGLAAASILESQRRLRIANWVGWAGAGAAALSILFLIVGLSGGIPAWNADNDARTQYILSTAGYGTYEGTLEGDQVIARAADGTITHLVIAELEPNRFLVTEIPAQN